MTAFAGLRKAAAGRVLAAASATLVTVAAVVVMPADPAAATRRSGMVASMEKPGVADFPAITGAYPRPVTTDDGIFTPDECAIPPSSNVCDTIPLKIIAPQLGPFDDWFVRVTLSWTPNEAGTLPGQSGRLLELDVYFWDAKQLLNDGTYTRIARAQTTLNPEKFEVIRPSLGDYNLTVSNWNGRNTGYKVKVEVLKGDPFDAVFESTEPIPDLSVDAGGPITDFSSDLLEFNNTGIDTGGFGLEELGLPGDEFLNLGEGPSDLPAPALDPAANVRLPRPGPASGILMILWLVLVPLAIGGGVAGYLFRRSSRTEWSFA